MNQIQQIQRIQQDSADSSDDYHKIESSSDSEGAIMYKQTGGYNVNRYHLSRLNRYDKDLFSKYHVKQHKSTAGKDTQNILMLVNVLRGKVGNL